MSFTQGMITSNTDKWATPQKFFDKLNDKYKFEVDVCATQDNTKCPTYFTEEEDGLRQKWEGRCWCNPPYGRKIGLWLEKAYKSSIMGALVVCLVPARTDTKWWNNWAVKGDIEFIKGRLKFSDAKNSAPFPSAVITYLPPSAPGFGVFPEFDIINEIILWDEDRIEMMAPWLLPYLNGSNNDN